MNRFALSCRLAVVALALTSSASAQDNWVRITTTPSPAARQFHAMAFDAVRREFVMFGGFGSGFAAIGDTWTFNGTTWTQKTPSRTPSVRGGHRMVFDAARGEVVLFGGGSSFGSATFNQTWTWDGTTWTQRTPATSPTARFEPGMVYDAARQEVVLFGGNSPSGLTSDTWVWNGTTWTQRVVTGPTARSAPMVTFDSDRAVSVLFGGGSPLVNDTWEWNGATWRRVTTAASPLARYRGGLAYDPVRRRCLLFGGFSPFRNDTWSFDGTNWTQLTPATVPLARDAFGFEFDPDRGCVYMFGGDGSSTPQNDSWRWCSRGVTRSYDVGCAGSGTTAPTLSAAAPAIGGTWNITQQTTVPNSPAALIFGASSSAWGSFSLPLDLTPFGFAGCRLVASVDVTASAAADGTGAALFSVPVPPQISLLGSTLYLQGVNANLGWSAGLAASVGH